MPSKNTLLWKITNQQNTKSSYLFGTMHIWDERAISLMERAAPYINEADIFAAETVIAELNELPNEVMFLPQNKTLADYFTAKKLLKIQQNAERILGMPYAQIAYFCPMVLSNFFATKAIANQGEYRIDDMLWQFATSAQKPCIGIESVEEQMAIFRKIPLPFQCKQLSDTVKNVGKYTKEYKKTAVLYEKMDILGLYHHAKASMGKLRKPLVYDRNLLMAERIFNLTNEKSAFVAVGAGHLAGQKGLINLLRKKGLKVEMVAF
jgi:uncharacterized protein